MASIFLAELDADVIGLGEDCTNPFFAKPAPAAPAAAPPPAGRRRRMQLSVEADDDALALPKPKGIMRTAGQSTQAVVSVADCLACSGCVTSAEAVLVNAQSADKFRDLCGPDARVFLGLAALASFGERLDCAPARAFAAVAAVLREAHGAEALSEAAAAATARAETVHEFAARLAAGAGKPEIPAPSIAVSATRYRRPDGATVDCGPAAPRTGAPLPLVASACPGVVCFVEKTAPHALPYLASTKSPTAAAAALWKRLAPSSKVVAVEACADKKLEAARRDLSGDHGPDVDLVLTAQELWDVLTEAALRDALADAMDDDDDDDATVEDVAAAPFAASGGFAEAAYRAAAGASLAAGAPVPFKREKNDDFVAAKLDRGPGLKPLVFAVATGFRNVQRVTSQLKKGTCPYDFVELLACPVRFAASFFGGKSTRAFLSRRGPRDLSRFASPLQCAARASGHRSDLPRARVFQAAWHYRDPHPTGGLRERRRHVEGRRRVAARREGARGPRRARLPGAGVSRGRGPGRGAGCAAHPVPPRSEPRGDAQPGLRAMVNSPVVVVSQSRW